MASLGAIAELARRNYLLMPNADSGKKQREFELLAQASLAWICRLSFFNENTEGERQVNEVWLKSYEVAATKEDDIWQLCLPAVPIDLKDDVGVYRVAPKSRYGSEYRKTSISRMGLVGDLPSAITKRYYRINNKIFFPDGLLGEIKDTDLLIVRSPSIDCEDEDLVPDDFAPLVLREIAELINNPNRSANSSVK